MNIWAISLAGNNATLLQAGALTAALQAVLGGTFTIIQPSPPKEAVTLPNNTIVTWTKPPDAESLRRIGCAKGGFDAPLPDLVIACRPEVAALALAIKAASGNRTRIIQIQDPNDKTGAYKFDRSLFDLIVKQSQEEITGSNVIASKLPLHDLSPETLATYRGEALKAFPRYRDKPPRIILLGGSDEHVNLTAEDFAAFGADIASLSDAASDIFVLSSRRTSRAHKEAFIAAIENDPHIFFDHPGMPYKQALGCGGSFVVDGTSGSMIADILATGKPVAAYAYRGKLEEHPLWRQGVLRASGVNAFPWFKTPTADQARNEIDAIAAEVIATLRLRRD